MTWGRGRVRVGVEEGNPTFSRKNRHPRSPRGLGPTRSHTRLNPRDRSSGVDVQEGPSYWEVHLKPCTYGRHYYGTGHINCSFLIKLDIFVR